MGVLKLNKNSSIAAKQIKKSEYVSTSDAVPAIGDESEPPRGEGEITNLTVWSSNDHLDIINKAIKVDGGDNYEFEIQEESYDELENQLKEKFLSGENTPDISIYRDEKIYDIVKSYEFAETDLSNLSSDFFEHKVNLVTSDDGYNVFGVPCTSDIAGLYYNRTILEQCGIDPEDFKNLTWDQVMEIAETIKANLPDVYAFPPLTSELQILIRSLDANCFSESAKLINPDAAQQIFDLLKTLRDHDYMPLAHDNPYNELVEYIMYNKCAFIMGGPWIYSLILENSEDSQWGVTRVPTSDIFVNQVSMGGSSWLVTQTGSEERAFDFLTQTFGVSDEVALSIAEKNLVPAWKCYCLSELEYDSNIFDKNVIEFLNDLGNEVESFDSSEYVANLSERLFNDNTMSFFDICENIVSGEINPEIAMGYYGEPNPYEPPTPSTPPELKYIRITNSPDKTAYYVGDIFNKNGMEVTAYFDDGSSYTVNNYKIIDENRKLTISDNKIIIEYSYMNVTATTGLIIKVSKRIEDESKINQTELKYECSAGTASVNLFTGRLLFEYKDYGIGAGNYRIELSHVYNSCFIEEQSLFDSNTNNSINTGMGRGFKLNVQQYLLKRDENYIYIDGTGFRHKFKQIEQNKYYDESGLGLILDLSSNVTTISDEAGNIMVFDRQGRLSKKVACYHSDMVTYFNYDSDGRLAKIFDGRNIKNVIELSYNNDGLLQSMSCLHNSEEKYVTNYEYDDMEMNLQDTRTTLGGVARSIHRAA